MSESAAYNDGLPLSQRRLSRGSMKAGPSEDYKALLRGEITPEEYVRRMMADVDARLMPNDDVPGAGWQE
jgi:hypothetical protein